MTDLTEDGPRPQHLDTDTLIERVAAALTTLGNDPARMRDVYECQLDQHQTVIASLKAKNERQAAEIAHLNKLLSDTVQDRETAYGNHQLVCMELDKAQAEIARLKAKDWDLENDALSRRLDEAQAEIARLKEALKPFAKLANTAEQQYANHMGDIAPATLDVDTTLGPCRAARAALASSEDK